MKHSSTFFKVLLIQIFLMLVSYHMDAQKVVVRYDNATQKFGLLNETSNKWILKPQFEGRHACEWIMYKGEKYFVLRKGGMYALYDESGKQITPHIYTNIFNPYVELNNNGYAVVTQETGEGLISLSPYFEIIPCKYKFIADTYKGASFSDRNGKNKVTYTFYQLNEHRAKVVKEAEAKKQREYEEKLAAERKANKEKELHSFTSYAKNFVEPKINSWQVKGEFEKLANYRNRVTGPNRSAMIDSLTNEAEKNFLKENAELHPENLPMTLNVYDSENEVFSITSQKFGTILIDVPIDKAPTFKNRFFYLKRVNPQYFIDHDTLQLSSLTFKDEASGELYTYSNRKSLSYKQYQIDPDTYEFNVVSVTTNNTGAGVTNNLNNYKKPSIKILSPASGSNYTTEEVTIRYQVTTHDGSKPIIKVWINGEEVENKNLGSSKGVKKNYEELVLKLPTASSKSCNIMLSAVDNNGTPSENKTLSLFYSGALHKPNLYLFSVGVSNYTSESLTKLAYASKDARDFVATIKGSDLSMYSSVSDNLISDATAKKSNIEMQLSALVQKVKQDDVVMLFFSGHGVRDGEDAYFMSVDANGNEPYTGVDFNLIKKNVIKLKDKKCRVVLFMDACYAGTMYGFKGNRKEITFAEPEIIGFYSSTANQESAELKDVENGVFTRAVLEGLKGKAANSNGEITTGSLQSYVSDEVINITGGKQNPIVENKLGDIVLFKIK